MGKRIKMERRMKNKRYKRTEDKILGVFFIENKKGTTMGKIAKKAGICRATMYAHHHTIREILPDYENYILAEYRSIVKKRLKLKNDSPKTLYFDMLTFILRRRKIFRMFLGFNDRDVLMRMLGVLKLKTTVSMRLPKGSEKILKIYQSEIVEVIFCWGKTGFLEDKLEEVLSDMVYLTDTARDRLMPIG